MRAPLIDTHVHVYSRAEIGRSLKAEYQILDYGEADEPVRFSDLDGDVDDALIAIDRASLDYVAVLNIFELDGWPSPSRGVMWSSVGQELEEHGDALIASNSFTCSLRQRSSKVLPFISLHPGVLSRARMSRHLEESFDNGGARGVKLHPNSQRIHPADPAMDPVYVALQERDLPLVTHVGVDKRGQGLAEFPAFAELLQRHPLLTLVAAHLGGSEWRQAEAFAQAHPTVRFDLCEIIEWVGSRLGPTAVQLAQLIRAIGADRVLLGSDFPWYEPHRTIQRVYDLPLLSLEEKEAICGRNAARLLHVDL